MDAKTLVVVLSLSSIIGISLPLLAQQKADDKELLARLERMASENEWKIRTSTGAPHLNWLLHQRKVTRLIDQLKSGQPVDPAEIDKILKEHSR